MYLKGRMKESKGKEQEGVRKRENQFSIQWLILQMNATGSQMGAKISMLVPILIPEPFSTAFPDPLAGGWTGSRTANT